MTSSSFRGVTGVPSGPKAFTLLELVISITILGILAALALHANRELINRSEGPACMANIRSIGAALGLRQIDLGHWPQLPEDVEIGSRAEEEFWIAELKPFGISEKTWLCPTLKRLAKPRKNSADLPLIHYMPTVFDDKPMTPQLSGIPWVIEIGNMHRQGNNMYFPSGVQFR
jgi:prepilin-type N-terminal cleavage/methylation domain-containing protein